jgi:hypothetical protein
LNGNGGGNATGKPCAGCVGQADNKRPGGQASQFNSTHRDAGYECNRNNGIGKSNPAHTGCKQPTPSTPPGGSSSCTGSGCTSASCTGSGCTPTTPAVPPAQVLGLEITRSLPGSSPTAVPAVLPATLVRSPSKTLPFTGANVIGMVMAALGLLLVGAALVLQFRRDRVGLPGA